MGAWTDEMVADGAYLAWKLNDSGTTPYVDVSGNARPANNVNNTGCTREYSTGLPGDLATGVRFGAGHAYGRFNTIPVVDDFVMEVWVNPLTLVASEVMMSAGDSIYNSFGWSCESDASGIINRRLSGGAALNISGALALTADEWNHLVVARRATVWECWINGVQNIASARTETPNTTGNLGFGGVTGGAIFTPTADFVGFAYFSTILTTAQIEAHYALGVAAAGGGDAGVVGAGAAAAPMAGYYFG